MAAVPFLASLALAHAICPLVVRKLWERGWTRPNAHGARVAHPAGLASVLAALALYGELRSISALVERRTILRRIDSLGRTHA